MLTKSYGNGNKTLILINGGPSSGESFPVMTKTLASGTSRLLPTQTLSQKDVLDVTFKRIQRNCVSTARQREFPNHLGRNSGEESLLQCQTLALIQQYHQVHLHQDDPFEILNV